MNNQTFTNYNRDELKKLKKDQLLKICLDNNITVKKSSNKTLIIDDIINIKGERDRLQKKLVDDNPSNQFHRGHVEYKLPILIITKILELTWMQATSDRITLISSYRQALQLTLINKQFFGIVSLMFNNVRLRSKEKSRSSPSLIGKDLKDRLTSVWCPIKHIVKLKVGILIFEQLMKQNSAHLTHILSTVEKLNVVRETKIENIKENCLKTFVKIATNLRSLCLYRVKVEPSHLIVICSIKSLRKIDISHTFSDIPDFLTTLCNGLPFLESIKSGYFHVTDIPKSCRSRIKKIGVKLGETEETKTDETFEFPNLQKLSVYIYSRPVFFKYFSQSNITHLSLFLNNQLEFDQWIAIIIELKSRMKDLHHRLISTWWPIKHIVKLQVSTLVFEKLMKQPSSHL
ncbi:hypothetical protein PPL_03411 [Heterostelium album PN500]|uniref:Uncharacterized protein n=1 Tax=Heterostelium pallidum (strain ATCC 26659 / Pp 5 / PN500) TaxID=670386 RepID=D3B4T5_HETP5|nr:hypothetical protein PPL_03411 [Heterostelium album PN500]EFA84333.1 hypothetical protein PPL_03411 [Heterostelium album PN500]|eukprot:XP_020436448.1 hypothetical protein PPL_03411 [Heterostelium album PN500]